MNQGKLEVVKQEMERVNVNILGINELKWTGMGKFNSDDLTFISLIHFEFIFVYGVRECSSFILLKWLTSFPSTTC